MLGWGAVTVVIAAWLVVLIQIALIVRAEVAMQQILRQANAFAELPSVRPSELQRFVAQRAKLAGWRGAQVWVAPRHSFKPGSLKPGRAYQVARIELPMASALPESFARLSVFGPSQVIRVGAAKR